MYSDLFIANALIKGFCFTTLLDHFVYAPIVYDIRGHSVGYNIPFTNTNILKYSFVLGSFLFGIHFLIQ